RGDVLAVLESTNLKAQLDEGGASLGEAEREYNRQSALWRTGVTSRALVDSAEAQLKAARARVQQMRINMQDMAGRAPFDRPSAEREKAIVKVKVAIIDPAERLLPEMSASASFLNNERTDAELHEPARIWIPAAALVDGKRVAIVGADKHVKLQPVTTGASRENRVEITGGLREGDRIVTTNADALRDGQLVQVRG